jgi:hypothetical protein
VPGINIEFTVPEDPSSNTVSVTITGPDQKRVVEQAMATIEHYASGRSREE